MKEVKTKKYKGSLVLKIALLCFGVYIVFTLISQQVKINEKKTELLNLSNEVTAQEVKNDEIQHSIDDEQNGDAAYAEQYARSELDYAKQGERVYVNIDGN